MTRQEAIDILCQTPFWVRFTEEEKEAMSMAIRSLETWDDVIEEIQVIKERYSPIEIPRDVGGEEACDSILRLVKEHLKEVEE